MATTAIEQLSMWSSFPKWLHIVSLWFTGTERWRARAYVSVCALISVLTTAFAVQISYAQRRFSTALSERDVEGFHAAVWQFVAIICIAAPLAAIDGYVQGRLVLAWRAYLTRRLVGAYFDRNAFFHLKLLSATAADSDDGMPARLDNPDMRITDDVNSFTSASTGLLLGLLRKVLNCIAFAGVLWSISPSLVLFLFLYAGLGTWVTGTVFGRKLMALKWRHLQREGDLRFSLTRVRDNAESIAFINGSAREAATVNHRVDDLVGIVKSRILWGGFLDLWTGSYSYATILLPSILTAPRYFAREVEFGVISQAGYAFGRIEAALSIIVDQLETMSGLAAQVDRLDTLFSALRHSAGTGDEYSLDSGSALGKSTIERLPLALSSGDSVGQTLLKMDNLTLQLPGSTTTVCNSLSLSLSDGESLLIAGPSGCGKSSLLRAVAGLWSRGSGVVRYPSDTSALDGGMFFLPQKPYMMLGSLRQQLEFPSELAAPEKLLLSLLDVVNLADLPERVGGMDRQIDWQHVLSVGEQQRLGFVRLLLHRPRLAFLDEATSALDPQSETRMYSELRRTCRCFVSVGHRPALVQYHSLVLRNCAPGQWELLSRQQYQQRMDLADAETTALP